MTDRQAAASTPTAVDEIPECPDGQRLHPERHVEAARSREAA